MANLILGSVEGQIVALCKALYDAAPGYTYLTALKSTGGTGSDAALKVSAYLNTAFAGLSNAAWADLIVANLHLTGAVAQAGKDYLLARLAGDTRLTRAQLLLDAVHGLASLENDATFGASAKYFNESTALAFQYSLNPANSTTDLATLKTADEPPVSTGSVYLTANADNLSGTVFFANPIYTPGGNDYINSLQDEDVLTGTGAANVLNAQLGSVNDAAESTITPTLNNIQTVNLQITGQSVQGVNFQDATGLNTLNITRVTANNPSLRFDDLPLSAATLGVTNASTNEGQVRFEYREDVLLGTSDTLALNVGGTRLDMLSIDENGDEADASDRGYGFETVNITNSGTSSNIDTLSIGANQREDVAHGTNQTINIDAKSALEINQFTAAGAEFITINAANTSADLDVMIAKDEREVLAEGLDASGDGELEGGGVMVDPDGAGPLPAVFVSDNDGISTAELQKLTITGAGVVAIDGLDGDTDGATLTVDASAMTNTLMLGVAEGADGKVSTVFANRLDEDLKVTSGSGNDLIRVYTNLAGDISTNAGDDTVWIGVDGGNNSVEGVSNIDTGAGNDSFTAADLMATANDQQNNNSTFGQVQAATVVTGEGNDAVVVNDLLSQIDYNHGSVLDANADDKHFVVGASINTGAGDDTLRFNSAAEGASIDMGTGNDTVTVEQVGQTVLAADTAGTVEVNADGSANALGAIVQLGDGNDSFNLVDSKSLTTVGSTLVGKDAELRAGAGTDVLNVTTLDGVNVNVLTTYVSATDNDINVNITGVETANFTVANQIDLATATAVGSAALENDNVETDGAVTADVKRFDTALTAINLDSQEQAMLQSPATEVYEAGQATAFTLNNLRAAVALTLKANEATGVDGKGNLKDDEAIDVNLTVNMDVANSRGDADTFTLAFAQGSGAFDLNLNVGVSATDEVGDKASATDDDDKRVEHVVINLAADDKGHRIAMNGFGDAGQTNAMTEGTRSVATSFTVNGGTAGTTLVVEDVNADTITIAGGAHVKLRTDASNNYNITTGAGNDVIDMRADDVRADDKTDDGDADTTDTVDEGDKVNAAGGTDRLIINGNDTLGTYVGVGAKTDDDVFVGLKSIENLEIQGGGSNSVVIDEAAATTGTNLQNIYLTGAGAQTTNVQIGENFVNDSGTVKDTITIDSTVDLSGDRGAVAKTGAVTLNIENQDTDQDTNVVNLAVKVGMEDGARVNFDNTGDKSASVTVTAIVSRNFANTVANDVAAAAGVLGLRVGTGSVDKVVLLDSTAADTGAVNPDNGNITVTMHDSWASGAFELDASAVANNDIGAGADGGATVEELEGTTGQTQVAGIQARDTGGLLFNGAAETNATLTVKGTGNDDDITGSNQADTLFGNDGDDIIRGGLGNDSIDAGAGNDDLQGGIGNDVMTAGAGNDVLYGAVGADTLTGGAGADNFRYLAVTESNGDGADTITDFETGVDKIKVEAVVAGTANRDYINLASFATVQSAGDGDNSLLGNTGVPANDFAVMGDAYFATDSGQLVIDVDGNGDITTGADLVIKSPGAIVASDIDYTISAGAGNDFIRGGQGSDDLNGGAGADTFIVVGTLSSSEASAYAAAYQAGGSTDTAIMGAQLAAVSQQMLRASELMSARSGSEVNTGDKINSAGADAADMMHVFGTADLTKINAGAALNVGALFVHSTVYITQAQLAALGFVLLDGNVPHTIVVTDANGAPLTQAAQEAALTAATVFVINNGSLTTITIGGGAAMTVAQFNAGGFVNPAVTVSVAGVAGLFPGVPYNLQDTSANLAAAVGATLNSAVNIVSTDTATVAQATVIEAATNSGTAAVASLSDTAAAIAGSSNAVLNIVGGTVTATTAATGAQAITIAAFTKAVVYSVSDTAAGVLAAVGAGLNEAVNITVTDSVTVAQAATIEAATNTGTETYNISDSATNIALSSNAALSEAGTVTANTAATGAQAITISGFTKAVVYNVNDTVAAVVGAYGVTNAALNEAVNVTATGVATVAQATTIEGASNTGTTTVDSIQDLASAIAASSNAVLTIGTTVTATSLATVAEANTIAAFAKAVSYSVSDTAANFAAATAGALNEAVNLTVTDTATVALATTLEAASNTGTVSINAISDTAAAVSASSNAVLNQATTVTVTTAATVAQAALLEGLTKVTAYAIADAGATIGGMTAAALGSAKITGVDASDNTLSLNVAQATALTNAKMAAGDTITLADTGANLAGVTVAAYTAFTNVDAVNASDDTLTINAAQVAAITNAKLTGADTVTMADTGANLGAISAATYTSYTNVDAVNASDDVLSVNLAQAAAITNAKLAAGDVVTLADTGANLGAEAAATYTGYTNVDVVNASDDVLSINLAQAAAITNAKLTAGDAVTLADTGANLAATTVATFTGYTNVDTIDASDNAITLNVAQELAIDSKLVVGDAITVSDTGANIAGMTAAQIASTKIDTIDASDNAITFNVAQAVANDAALTAGDVITVSDTGANISAMTAAQLASTKLDVLNASDNVLSLNLAQHAALVASANLNVDASDAITVTGAFTAALNYATAGIGTIGGASVTLNDDDNAATIDGTDLAALVADATLAFTTTGDVITITGAFDGTGDGTTAYTAMTAAAVGGASRVMDDSDNTVTMTSAQVNTFNGVGGLSFAATDNVTITQANGAGAVSIDLTNFGGNVMTVNLTNTAIALADADTITVAGFDTTKDKFWVGAAGTSFQTITAAGTALTAGHNGVVEIESGVGTVLVPSNAAGGAVESLIAAAIGNATSVASGNDLVVIVYGNGNAYIYQVDVTLADADLDAADIVIELVGTLTGVTANALGGGNVGP